MEEGEEEWEEELTALEAIYPDRLTLTDRTTTSFKVTITLDHHTLLFVHANDSYPAQSPHVRFHAPHLRPSTANAIRQKISRLLDSQRGRVLLFSLVSSMDEWLGDLSANDFLHAENKANTPEHPPPPGTATGDAATGDAATEDTNTNTNTTQIWHSEALHDRKSVFQAHLAVVNSVDEVQSVLNQLKSDRKIARATHNIMAYRLVNAKGVTIADNDDDGETAAGKRLAELLYNMKVSNLLVVVSRYFGGIHLGPARFKHINNVARGLITATLGLE